MIILIENIVGPLKIEVLKRDLMLNKYPKLLFLDGNTS